MRALPAAVTLMDQARAWKHDTDLGNRLTDRAFGLLGRNAVLPVIGLQNAGKRPDCAAPAREQVIDLAGAGTPGSARYGLIKPDEGFWSRVDAWAGQLGLTAPVDIVQASEMPGAGPAAGYGGLAAGDLRGEEDEQA